MKKYILPALLVASLMVQSCSENYANGERIGLVTQFSRAGVIWKSWEGHLNLTQTGMNSSSNVPFDFSIDNDNERPELVKKIDSAAQFGWKVKLVYHETVGKNWFSNRGETNHFVSDVQVLDKNPVGSVFNGRSEEPVNGRVVDTIYVVIDKSKE
ncbi:MAG: hypothetical protein K0S09_1985 [Sphingobacteriaceae bacterium]|jgi:hypothetical protein|nr:hypothetical protein [Sphingobacteriaceae bacterium]